MVQNYDVNCETNKNRYIKSQEDLNKSIDPIPIRIQTRIFVKSPCEKKNQLIECVSGNFSLPAN